MKVLKVIIEEISEQQQEQIIIKCESLTARQMRAIELLRSSEFIICYKDSTIYRMSQDEVLYCEVVDRRVFAYTNSDVYEIKTKLADLEEMLEDRFVRISRTILLNWEKIYSLSPLVGGRLEATLENDEKITISRQYVNVLKEKFGV